MKKSLLSLLILPFIALGFYIFPSLEQEEDIQLIYIEPIVIPEQAIEEDKESEILEKLKLATEEALEQSRLSEEEAMEVLVNLKRIDEEKRVALVEKRAEEKRVALAKKRAEEKRVALAKKRAEEKRVALAKKRAKEKRVALAKKRAEEKRVALAKKRAKEKRVALSKKRAKEKRMARAKKIKREKRIALAMQSKFNRNSTIKKENRVVLGVQPDLYTLSKEEQKKFKHLETVSHSKIFVLEDNLEIKNPEKYFEVEKEIAFEKLPFVETLGVVSVSKPFVKNN